MKVLMIRKNQALVGGAEIHADALDHLLTSHGHEVDNLFIEATEGTIVDSLMNLLMSHKPDIAHFHSLSGNAPLMVSLLCGKNIPCVLTVHDTDLICSRGDFIFPCCEKCLKGRFFYAAINGCQDIISAMKRYIFQSIFQIDIYNIDKLKYIIYVSETQKNTFLKVPYFQGTNSARLYNFMDLKSFEAVRNLHPDKDSYLLYFGRLAKNKGINTLIDAAKGFDMPLYIAGSGDMEKELSEKAANNPQIKLLGRLDGKKLAETVTRARMTIVPSECEEGLGQTVLESMLLKTPVIVSDKGALPELAGDGRGQIFPAKDAAALHKAIKHWLEHPEEAAACAESALKFAEFHCDPDAYYEKLMKIYEESIKLCKKGTEYTVK